MGDINEISREGRDWVVEINDKFSKMKSIPPEKRSEKRRNTISPLPPRIRNNFDSTHYGAAPYVVSFGPYNHKEIDVPHNQVQALQHEEIAVPCHQAQAQQHKEVVVQDHKEIVVLRSLKRCNKTIDDYVRCLNTDLQTLKNAYDELDSKWEHDDAFLQLMIFDGCFFLEILRAANDNLWDNPVWETRSDIDPKDLMQIYRQDMLLLDNQLPLLVLEKLLDVQGIDEPKGSVLKKIHKVNAQEYLNEQILKFFFPRINLKIPTKKFLHALDLYRFYLLSQGLWRESKSQYLWLVNRLVVAEAATEFHFNIPSASNLDQVGIGFASTTKGLWDISYGSRTLRLPHLSIDGATKRSFLNVLAFEQLHEDVEYEVTSYIYLMSNLIKSVDDIHLLKRCGIIDTRVHEVDQIVAVFGDFSKFIDVDDPKNFIVPRYGDVIERLANGYYNMNKPWRKDLWQTYLRSPWAIVSILVAFLLFALATVQTVYTVLSFYKVK